MTDDTPHEQHNSGARADLIRNACRDIAALDASRKEIGAEIAEIKQKIVKGDLGMKISDFNVAYRLHQLEQKDRDSMIDTVRECFVALGIGEQLDFVKAWTETHPNDPKDDLA